MKALKIQQISFWLQMPSAKPLICAASLLLLAGCAEWSATPARVQANYGQSVRNMVDNQLYNPPKAQFPAALAPDGMEANKADTILNGGAAYDGLGYRTDIGKPEAIGHSTLGRPGLTTQGGSGGSTR